MSRDDDQLGFFNQMFEGKRTQRYHHVSTLSPNLESETETIPFLLDDSEISKNNQLKCKYVL